MVPSAWYREETHIGTMIWREVECKNAFNAPCAREAHSCVAVKDCLYVFGGFVPKTTTYLNDLYKFDFNLKQWFKVPTAGDILSPRSGHTAVVYKDSMYVYGGKTQGGGRVTDLFEFNTVTQRWREITVNPLGSPMPRSCHSSVVYGTSMYCFGGYFHDNAPLNAMHEFKFETGSWSPVQMSGAVPCSRYSASMVVHGSRCLLFGGTSSSSNFSMPLDTVHVFDFGQRKWSVLTTTGATPGRRVGHAAVVDSNTMYIYGGGNFGEGKSHIYALDLVGAGAWRAIPVKGQLNVPARNMHAMVAYNSTLYVLGGNNFGGTLNDFVQCHLHGHASNSDAANESESVISYLRDLVNNEMMSDVTFIIEDQPVYAHKNLCMRCEYFKAMFTGVMQESTAREVVISDVKHPIFLAFLEYLYTDSVDLTPDAALDLLVLADKYGVDQLKCVCESRVVRSLSIENVASILPVADMHNAPVLRKQSLSFMLNHFDAVTKTTTFEQMLRSTPDLTLEVLRSR